jgi:hypothetical protein
MVNARFRLAFAKVDPVFDSLRTDAPFEGLTESGRLA